MPLYRPQRGNYKSSMREIVDFETFSDLEKIIFDTYHKSGAITIEPYGLIDMRNGWKTHIVCLDGEAVGFTDGPIQNANI